MPRAPGAVPLLGHVLQLVRDPFTFLSSLRQHGDVVRVNLGTLPVYFVTSADLAQEVLVRQARRFEKGRFFDQLKPLVGNGIATASGEVHHRNRRLLQPMFTKERIAGYSDIMSRNACALADAWQPGQTVDLELAMAEYSIETLAETLFSTDIGRPAVKAVRDNLPVVLANLLKRAMSPKALDRLPIRANREFDAAAASLKSVIDDVIAAARREGTSDRNDLLSLLLKEKALSDTEVRDELSTILFAGAETTAASLAWTFHELASHPDVEKKIVAEIHEVVGDRQVTIQDIPKLMGIRRALDEAVRLHGVTLLMRRTTTEVELGGVTLPAGTEVAFSLYAIHRDPNVFDDAGTFNPDRWLPENRDNIPRGAFTPFGAGNHKCIGDQYAWTEATIALATLLSQWQFTPVPGHTPKEVASAVAHADSIPMTVTRRARDTSR
ncbi:cytochrome P450 [Streptomyces sp. NPDC060064]|uniref:cytochrome P450 n=1 Tax=Streptomyces sp. NPDC060064 TaxID=3347049 RepID=UPI0036BCB760